MQNFKLIETRKGWTILNQDDEELLEISLEEYVRFYLYEKEEITNKDYIDIKNFVDYKNAKRIANKYNIFKNRSGEQIKKKLLDSGYNCEIIESVINDMIEDRQIDDIKNIKKFIRDRLKLNPKSKKILKYELIKKGFSIVDVELCIREICKDDLVTAREMFNKKLNRGYSLEKAEKHLKNRGFDYEVIRKVTNEKSNNE